MSARPRWTAKRLVALFEAHRGLCGICGGKIGVGEAWEREHEIPLGLGGEDTEANCRPVHVKCHRAKTREDVRHIAKAKRMRQRQVGVGRQTRSPVPGSKGTPWKRKIDGQVVRRDD